MNFDSMQFAPGIMKNIRACGYEEPTPIQRETIPLLLQNQDLIGLAQTGTGKTAAFVLPMLQRLSQGRRKTLRALILAPTRELAEQIFQVVRTMSKGLGLYAATVYGGVSINSQIAAIKKGAEIIVACPGRLLDHLRQKTLRLSHVEYLVLDEADRMFDMGFIPDVRKILSQVPAKRQTMLFSATMPDPIRRLANDYLRNPATVQIAHARPAQTVSHAIYPVANHRKTDLLIELLKRIDSDSVLVFVRTKIRTERLTERLKREKYSCACLMSDLSQTQRQKALGGFRSGKYRILVATDIAARGLDISTISHVINFDMPNTADDYTHRIGRTGRASKLGDAFTFATGDDETLVKTIEQIIGAPIEKRFLDNFDSGIRMHSAILAAAKDPSANNPALNAMRRFQKLHQPRRRPQRLRPPSSRR